MGPLMHNLIINPSASQVQIKQRYASRTIGLIEVISIYITVKIML